MAKIDLNEDTIAAVATPLGEGAVGIVRVSGREALNIVDRIFKGKNKKSLLTQRSFSLRYGWIIDKDGQVVDEVVISIMRAPKSYTRQDVVEINSHGGMRPLQSILELILENGARLAQAGEFTKRAFLNGRIDLSQAEAVLDIIESKSELALKNSLAQLKGAISGYASDLRKSIAELLADMEVNIDFGEDDVSPADENFLKRIDVIAEKINTLIERGLKARVVRDGLKVVIYGKPNVGKSSLLNAILKEDRAIVTSIAGTTRDTIEEYINIKGLAVRLIDTAGVIQYKNEIEKEALSRTRQALESADLVLFVLDASSGLDDMDIKLSKDLAGKKVVVVINKSDLKNLIDVDRVRKIFNSEPIKVSASKGSNIHALEDEIYRSIFDKIPESAETAFVSNTRHLDIFKKSLLSLEAARGSLSAGLSLEFVVPDIKKSLDILGEITGEVLNDELLDIIFSKFCVGK